MTKATHNWNSGIRGKPTAPRKRKVGFTLLEIIMVLLLISIVGVLTAPILTTVLKGTVMGTIEQQSADEAYWAAARLTSIVGLALDVNDSDPNAPQISVYDSSSNTTNWHTLAFNNHQILYKNELIWDNVHQFTYSFSDSRFEAVVQLVDSSHPSIPVDIHVRNHR